MKQRLFVLAAMTAALSVRAETKTWVAVLAEGESKNRPDIRYLAPLPLFNADGSPKA